MPLRGLLYVHYISVRSTVKKHKMGQNMVLESEKKAIFTQQCGRVNKMSEQSQLT